MDNKSFLKCDDDDVMSDELENKNVKNCLLQTVYLVFSLSVISALYK